MIEYVYILSGYTDGHEFIAGVYAKMEDAEKEVLTNYDLTGFIQSVNTPIQIMWDEEDGHISIEAYPIWK